jgi:hypothetical protein
MDVCGFHAYEIWEEESLLDHAMIFRTDIYHCFLYQRGGFFMAFISTPTQGTRDIRFIAVQKMFIDNLLSCLAEISGKEWKVGCGMRNER